MSGTIGYFEAWRQWFDGQEVDPQLRMWGLSILWWGRAGKLVSFVGGAVVILDLFAPDRLRHFARYTVYQPVIGLAAAVALALVYGAMVTPESGPLILDDIGFIPLMIGIVLFFLVAFGGAAGISMLIDWIVKRSLDRSNPGHPLRVAGVLLVFVGFHFDLLAS